MSGLREMVCSEWILDPDKPSGTEDGGDREAAASGAPRTAVENHSRSSWRNCSRT
jgi:hypothetical protein